MLLAQVSKVVIAKEKLSLEEGCVHTSLEIDKEKVLLTKVTVLYVCTQLLFEFSSICLLR